MCDNILGALLNIDGKSKDNLQARLDLNDWGIRKELHPVDLNRGRMYLPPACYSMSMKEREIFCKVLHTIKVPDGYSSNISRNVQIKEKKISGLKTHDCHILMQQLLPIALRSSMKPEVCIVLVQLCAFFNQLCSKVINIQEFEQLESQIAIKLWNL